MMKDGRLVWHRDAVGGSWSAIALDDERLMYIIARCHPGNGWQLFQRRRFTDDGQGSWLGRFRYLQEAKLAADHQHHHRILNAGLASEALKSYVMRYPL